MNTKNLLVGIGLCLLSACTEVDNKLEVDRALEYCDRQVYRTLEVMHGKGREVDYTMMPRNIMDGQSDWNYRKVSKEEWCGGFWPGILWYDYEYDTFIKHRVNNRKDCEDVLYALFLYHEKCRVNNKKTGMNKELPSAYKEGNIVVVDTSLKVSVNGSIKV